MEIINLLSNLPAWMQFVAFVLWIIIGVVPSIIALQSQRDKTRAEQLRIQSKFTADKNQQALIASQQDHERKINEQKEKHQREMEKLQIEAADKRNDQQAQSALFSLLQEQTKVATRSNEIQMESSQTQARLARNIEVMTAAFASGQSSINKQLADLITVEKENSIAVKNVTVMMVESQEEIMSRFEGVPDAVKDVIQPIFAKLDEIAQHGSKQTELLASNSNETMLAIHEIKQLINSALEQSQRKEDAA